MLKQKVLPFLQAVRSLPRRYTVGGLSIGLLLILGVIFFWPQTIHYSYEGKSCVGQPQVAAGLLKSVGSSDFALQTDGNFVIGGVSLAASKTCVTALQAPSPGEYAVTFALFGMPIGKQYMISVPSVPVASVRELDRPIPVSKPIELPLTVADNVFQYSLKVNSKDVMCQNSQNKVRCDIAKLGLNQGAKYRAELSRHFSNKKVATLASKEIMTLSATTVTDTSIKRDEVIYAKPKEMRVAFDKKIVSAKAVITRLDGEKKESDVSVTIDGQDLKLAWHDELDRSAPYAVTVSDVLARDGSSLVDPYVVAFKTSGGPRVTGINIPRTGVAMGSTGVVTFDQPLSDTQDISKIISMSGGAVIAQKQGNQLRFSLSAVPKCGDFSVKFSPDLKSNYDISGNSSWEFNGRMICHTVGSIGVSTKGRAINAFYFGNGPSTVVYTGAIHGNEVSTKILMEKWITELEANARSIPDNTSVVVVPLINPDGYAAGTRTNSNNVDLNRNFGTSDWKRDITTVTNAPFPGGGGDAPMSQPETKAIASLVSRVNARLVLSYHSIGGVLAANQVGNSSLYARTYSSLSGYSNTTGSSTTFEYAVSGTADDYYGERLGVPSVLIELGSHSYHQFERNQKAMWAMLR